MINLLDYGADALSHWVVQELGEPAFRARQLIEWMHKKRVDDFQLMSNLSQSLRDRLTSLAVIQQPECVKTLQSSDGTIKWLLRMDDGSAIETVFIPEKGRGTLCVSSQVGCALDCRFCATGKQGFRRNLSLAEIIGQLRFATQHREITNVVMMGMGEPLLNTQALFPALALMLSDHAYGLSKYRVTVSTSGVLPAMEQLKQAVPVALAVSLHAPNNPLRNQLVPLNKKYPLEQLIPVCDHYFSTGKHQVMFEYVMLDRVNDQLEHAKELTQLLRRMKGRCKINLIPFNPFPGSDYRTSTPEAVQAFQSVCMAAGFNTRVRRERGGDEQAACGQLTGEFNDKTQRRRRWLAATEAAKEQHG